jgi:HEAT repeat protein
MVSLAAALLCVASVVLPGDGGADGGSGSLEAFLGHARERRDAARELLRPAVEKLVQRLEEPGLDARPADLARLQKELDALGAEAATLLLPHLDPGAKPTPETTLRAQEVTLALVRAAPPGILDELLSLARIGSPFARANAIQVLAKAPDARRALPELVTLVKSPEVPVRVAAVEALAGADDPEVVPTLCGALSDGSPRVVSAALRALTAAHRMDAAPAVLGLTRTPAQAAPYAAEVLGYFQAMPQLVDDEVLDGLLGLARAESVPDETRVRVLEAFPTFEAARNPKKRRLLEPLFEYSSATVREAALAAAALLGDKTARRELFLPYDRVVEESPDWPEGYERRASVAMRVEDYAAAIRDLRRAIDLLSSRARQSVYRKLWIELARAYLRSGKSPKAVDTLEELGITEALKSEIGADPDFAPLREDPRFKKVFE